MPQIAVVSDGAIKYDKLRLLLGHTGLVIKVLNLVFKTDFVPLLSESDTA